MTVRRLLGSSLAFFALGVALAVFSAWHSGVEQNRWGATAWWVGFFPGIVTFLAAWVLAFHNGTEVEKANTRKKAYDEAAQIVRNRRQDTSR